MNLETWDFPFDVVDAVVFMLFCSRIVVMLLLYCCYIVVMLPLYYCRIAFLLPGYCGCTVVMKHE